jgi:hypothetical protein
MPCSNCGKERVAGQGLCSACYSRFRRNGSVARKNVINSGKCSVDGCVEKSFSKNLCSLHYQRHRGPVWSAWKAIRSKFKDEYPARWGSFEAFREDVGERPTRDHQLRRIDRTRPWSKTNAHWLPPVINKKDSMSPAERSVYHREWFLQRRFKITGDQFKEMLAAQGGGCAICGRPETHKGRKGKSKHLSVDHCHSSGKVRGLLCVSCNRGIGYFEDRIDRLRNAIFYLEKHN